MFSPEKFKAIVNSQTPGCVPALLRGLLTAMSVPWSAIVATRNTLYDARYLKVHSLDIPVVSVGNLTLGGTGKTPMVAWLAKYFLARGLHPGIISRGYKASNASEADDAARVATNKNNEESRRNGRGAPFQKYNDEARELDLLLEGQVPHFLCPDRVKAARALLAFEPTCDILILDDAFQHRRMGRTVDIVLLDALAPFGNNKIFPRGFLRESIYALRRADFVLLSRANLIDKITAQTIKEQVQKIAPQAIFAQISHRATAVRSSQGKYQTFESWQNERKNDEAYYAFCGIGNPDGFFQGLHQENVSLAGRRVLPDHCRYTRELLQEISKEAKRCGASGMLTTLKDYVKIAMVTQQLDNVFAMETGIEFNDNEFHFINQLDSLLSIKTSP